MQKRILVEEIYKHNLALGYLLTNKKCRCAKGNIYEKSAKKYFENKNITKIQYKCEGSLK